MALGSPYSLASVGGSMSGDTMQEQLAKLYAMSQALRQQSGLGMSQQGQPGMPLNPMPQGMQTGMQPYQPPQGGPMPQMQQMGPQQQQQGGGGMGNMLPMLMMMMMRNRPGLGSGGYPGAGFGRGVAGTMPGGQDY